MVFNEKNFNSKIPKDIEFIDEDKKILDNFTNNISNLRSFIDEQQLNSYVEFIVNALFAANKYFNDQEPWNKKSDQKRLNTIIYTSLELIRKISIMLYPIIPNSSLKCLGVFNIKEKDIQFDTIKLHNSLKFNSKISKIDILFKKILK